MLDRQSAPDSCNSTNRWTESSLAQHFQKNTAHVHEWKCSEYQLNESCFLYIIDGNTRIKHELPDVSLLRCCDFVCFHFALEVVSIDNDPEVISYMKALRVGTCEVILLKPWGIFDMYHVSHKMPYKWNLMYDNCSMTICCIFFQWCNGYPSDVSKAEVVTNAWNAHGRSWYHTHFKHWSKVIEYGIALLGSTWKWAPSQGRMNCLESHISLNPTIFFVDLSFEMINITMKRHSNTMRLSRFFSTPVGVFQEHHASHSHALSFHLADLTQSCSHVTWFTLERAKMATWVIGKQEHIYIYTYI